MGEGRQKSRRVDLGYAPSSGLCPHTLAVSFSFCLTVCNTQPSAWGNPCNVCARLPRTPKPCLDEPASAARLMGLKRNIN